MKRLAIILLLLNLICCDGIGDTILRFQAAEYLTLNIPGHYSYSNKYITYIRHYTDSVYANYPYWIRQARFNTLITESKHSVNKTYDAEQLSNDDILGYIDHSIGLRSQYSWYNYYSFKDFCEYILPYMSFNEPITSHNSKDSLSRLLHEKLAEKLAPHSYYFSNDINDVALTLEQTIYDLNIKSIADLLKDPTLKAHGFDCEEEAAAKCYLYNSLGIPLVYDFVPYWANKNGRHAWATSPYNLEKPLYNYAKIYRKTFSQNASPETDRPYETIPDLFIEPFLKDVTSLYGNTGDLSLTVSQRRRNFDNIYLHVFNGGEWRPVAWEKTSGKYIQFSHLGKGVVYLPGYCCDKGLIQEGFPIVLRHDSSCQELIPDIENTQTLRLFRKYPMTHENMDRVDALCGASILGYESNLHDIDTLAVIPADYMIRDTIKLNCQKRYKYIKIVADRVMQIAEIKLFDKAMKPIYFAPLSNDCNERAVNDADNLTYSSIIPEITLTVDGGQFPLFLKVMPRNDDNWINVGEVYELLYFGPDGWISCGEKRAVANYVEYTDVPSGALYLLRNLSKGVEERPFTWQNRQMVFW